MEKAKKALSGVFRNGFWVGVMVCMALRSLQLDYIGKEKFIELCQNSWIDPKITVPLAIVLLLFAYLGYRSAFRKFTIHKRTEDVVFLTIDD